MDVTPQLLTEVEFRQSLRGYDVDEVDGFLEEVAASVATLRGRLQSALQRADAGQGAPMTAAMLGDADGVVTTETITRTLLLAQQTADETVSAARDEASTLLGEAKAEAERVRTEAAAEAERLVSGAQTERESVLGGITAEAEALADQTRVRIDGELATLEQRRYALEQSVAAVEPELEKQRNRLIATATALTELVNDDDAFTLDLGLAPLELPADLLEEAGAEAPDETWAAPAGVGEPTEAHAFDPNELADGPDFPAAEDGTVDVSTAEVGPAEDAAVTGVEEFADSESPSSTSVFGAPSWTEEGPPTELVEVVDLTDSEHDEAGPGLDGSEPDEVDSEAPVDEADAARALDDFFDSGPNDPVRRFGRTRS